MMRWVQAIWHRFEKIIRYLFCSIISTVFDVAIVWCLYHLAGVSLVVANTVGVVAGFLISYVLSARQVFETRYDAASFAIFFATFLMGLVCADGQIRETFQQALFEGAYAVAHLQLDVPQQGEQFADFLRLVVRQFFTTEDQQIDV